jgi:hypothetical protein
MTNFFTTKLIRIYCHNIFWFCDLVSKACDTSKCQNGGSCQEEGNDVYSCLCPSGFTGRNCECKWAV